MKSVLLAIISWPGKLVLSQGAARLSRSLLLPARIVVFHRSLKSRSHGHARYAAGVTVLAMKFAVNVALLVECSIPCRGIILLNTPIKLMICHYRAAQF